jgi:hypothetical protein
LWGNPWREVGPCSRATCAPRGGSQMCLHRLHGWIFLGRRVNLANP